MVRPVAAVQREEEEAVAGAVQPAVEEVVVARQAVEEEVVAVVTEGLQFYSRTILLHGPHTPNPVRRGMF